MGAEEEVEVIKPVAEKEEPLPPLPKFGAILGSAGTGKTTLVKKYLAKRKDVVVSATTGVAALNTGGTTIHSRLGFYDLFSLQRQAKSGMLVKSFLSYYFQGTKVWIVDEVSMMGGDMLTILATAIDEANQELSSRSRLYTMVADHEDPDFSSTSDAHTHTGLPVPGGSVHKQPENARYISMVLVGDFAQLPPVNAPWAFESPAWKEKFAPGMTRLTTNYRQSDKDFIEALRSARSGHGPGALAYFRSMIHPRRDDNFGGLTIMATNKEVDEENARKLALCTGEEVRFRNKKEGEPHRLKDWKQVPDELVLKVGAKVMILANHRTHEEGLVYVNGDMGTLVGIDGPPRTAAPYDEDRDDTPREGKLPVVKLERNGREVLVDKAERDIKVPWDRATEQEKTDYFNHLNARKKVAEAAIERLAKDLDDAADDWERDTIQRSLDLEVKLWEEMEAGEQPDYLTVAWMTYTPIRLAYASTIHKCQGLTLDKIQIDLTSGFWTMCPGSLYVALSRARRPEGIRIVGSNERFLARCRSDWKVRGFV